MLGLQLAFDEPDGHDPVALGRVEQPDAGALPSVLVLELDLTESGEGVAHVGGVVNRQPPLTAGVDVGEGGVRELGAIHRVERGHVRTVRPISQPDPARSGRFRRTERRTAGPRLEKRRGVR